MYVSNPRRQNPIAFGMSRRFNRRGLGSDAVPSSATPNPPALTAGPSPLLVQSPVSSNPLDFASPQSAIAAGLDPTTVNTAWGQQVNSFASVQTAINSGIAPAVVAEFWTGGPPPSRPAPWWKRNGILLLAGGGVALLALFGDNREGR